MASKAFWAGTAYPSGAPKFTPVFSGVRVTRSLVLYVCFVGHCLSICTFLLAIVLSVLRYTDFDYPFGIFKLLLHMKIHHNQIINISVFSHPISDGDCSIFSNYIYWLFHRSSCWWLDRWRRNQGSVNLRTVAFVICRFFLLCVFLFKHLDEITNGRFGCHWNWFNSILPLHFCEKCLYHVMLSSLYVHTFMSDVFGGWVDL
jgi:hypothetical protein